MALRGNVIANYVGQGWTAVANVVFVPIFIHYLGIQSYALIGIYIILQAWLALLDLGMSPTLSREMARFVGGSLPARGAVELLRSVELVCGGFVLLCALLLVVAAPWIARYWLTTSLPLDEVVGALRLCGVVVAFRFMETIYRSALYGLDRQVWYNSFNIAVTTARFGGSALVLALVSPTVQAFFLWQVVVAFASVMVLRHKCHATLPRIAAGRFSGSALRGIGGFAGGLVAINLTALVLTQADKLIISHVLPLEMLGYYTFAYTVSNLVAAAVGPVSQAFYPVLSRHSAAGDAENLRRSYDISAQVAAVAAVTIAAILIFFPRELVLVWAGNVELANRTAPIIALLALGALANALLQIPYFALLARGEVKAPLYLNILAAAAFLAALLMFVPTHGLVAAAWAWFLVNLGMLIAMPLLVRRKLPVAWRDWAVRDVALPVAACFVVVGAIRALAPAGASRFETMVVLAVAGTAAVAASGLAVSTVRAVISARLGMFLKGRVGGANG